MLRLGSITSMFTLDILIITIYAGGDSIRDFLV